MSRKQSKQVSRNDRNLTGADLPGSPLLMLVSCAGYGPISWADLEVTAAKVANESDWRAVKKARGLPSSGDVISSAFGASWPLKLGRQDTDKPDPPGRLPPPNASVPEITVSTWIIAHQEICWLACLATSRNNTLRVLLE